MVTAPEAFMAVANATAAIVQRAPAYITYRVSGTVHYRRADAAISRVVTVRTVDGDAIVHDERTGRDEFRPPFPAPPTFDALAHWRLEGTWSADDQPDAPRDVDLRVINIEPLRYGPTISHADVLVRAVRGYHIAYAAPAEGQTHLHLQPTPDYFREVRRTAWITDVWYDPATLVPSRIVCAGNDAFGLDARYAIVDGVWLLRSIRVEQVFRSLGGLVRVAASFSGEYGDYRFSDTAPDVRLDASGGRTTPTSLPDPSRS